MAYSPTELLTVYLDARNQRNKVGRLAFKDRQVLFEYDASFIASGIEISPIKLPLRPGVAIADTTIFDGLFGVFNDSLPDGWGRLLLDRWLLVSTVTDTGTLCRLSERFSAVTTIS